MNFRVLRGFTVLIRSALHYLVDAFKFYCSVYQILAVTDMNSDKNVRIILETSFLTMIGE